MREPYTIFLISESKELLPYFVNRANLGCVPPPAIHSESGAGGVKHPGMVISRASRERIPALKNCEASSRLSTGKRRKLGDQSPLFGKGFALNQFSYTRRAFLSEVGMGAF